MSNDPACVAHVRMGVKLPEMNVAVLVWLLPASTCECKICNFLTSMKKIGEPPQKKTETGIRIIVLCLVRLLSEYELQSNISIIS